jgi:hypothetical protein
MRDALELDNTVIARASDPFIALLLWAIDKNICTIDEATAMMQFLRRNGYSFLKDIKGFQEALMRGCEIYYSGWKMDIDEASTALCVTALEDFTNLEVNLTFEGLYGSAKILHYSTPDLAEYLLDRGANPNSKSSTGQTPLDFVIDDEKPLTLKPSLPPHTITERIHRLCVLLVEGGGLLRTTTEERWEILLSEFHRLELDCSLFTVKAFPRWIGQVHKTAFPSLPIIGSKEVPQQAHEVRPSLDTAVAPSSAATESEKAFSLRKAFRAPWKKRK